MNFSLVCLIGIVSTIPFGLAFLLAPEAISSMYGVANWNPGTTSIARLFGAVLLYVGGACFAMKDTTDRTVQQRGAWTFSVVSVAAMLVALHSAATGTANSLMWSTVVLYVFFTIAWGSIALQKN